MHKIIVICGPTGIGKTRFSIVMAQEFNGEIIGADSMQIYQHMNIGTAKPEPHEVAAAPHHLIDFVDPAVNYDAGMYVRDADAAITNMVERGRLPIIAGGTGLYIKALLKGLFRSKPACGRTMEKLDRLLEEKGKKYLHDRLKACDPDAALRIHENDTFRVIRALEVFETTGRPISQVQSGHGFGRSRYAYLKLGLKMDRDRLYDRINTRVDMMLDAGLLNEVKQLMEMGYDPSLKSMQSIGYRQMGMYLKGEVDWDEAVRLLKRDTRRYAKRQFTWFNQDSEIHWIEPDRIDEAKALVKEFLT